MYYKVLEQISHFQSLGCDIAYQLDEDNERKVNRFQAICVTLKELWAGKQEKKLK